MSEARDILTRYVNHLKLRDQGYSSLTQTIIKLLEEYDQLEAEIERMKNLIHHGNDYGFKENTKEVNDE